MIEIYVSFDYDGVLDFKSPVVGVHEEKEKKGQSLLSIPLFFAKL